MDFRPSFIATTSHYRVTCWLIIALLNFNLIQHNYAKRLPQPKIFKTVTFTTLSPTDSLQPILHRQQQLLDSSQAVAYALKKETQSQQQLLASQGKLTTIVSSAACVLAIFSIVLVFCVVRYRQAARSLRLRHEELKATTRELEAQRAMIGSINEELQRANHELVVSRDDVKLKTQALEEHAALLYHINEELQHVNAELVLNKEEVLEQNRKLGEQGEELIAQYEELQQSQEEIATQRDLLSAQNLQLLQAHLLIEKQNQEMQSRNHDLEREVERRTHELLEYVHQLEQFSFISAHNLRGPVARILGLGQLLSMEETIGNEKELIVEKILESTCELDGVVRDLVRVLEIRKENSQTILELDLHQELENVEQALQVDIQAAHANISKQFSKVPTIRTIKSYLNSICYNILSNAIKYRHPSRAVQITVSADIVGNYWCLTFADNGVGINLDLYRKKLFQLYSRFHFHVEGKGLGLYMVKTQVEALHGRIEVESAVNEGTTFKVFLRRD